MVWLFDIIETVLHRPGSPFSQAQTRSEFKGSPISACYTGRYRKKVHWGSIESVTIPNALVHDALPKHRANNVTSDHHSARRRSSARRPRRSILKPPTSRDQEMTIRNLHNLLEATEKRVELIYDYLLEHGYADLLRRIMKAEETRHRAEARHNAFRDGPLPVADAIRRQRPKPQKHRRVRKLRR
ncbi:hypothetical protein FE257_009761 [Aspergillus nanangensis]|uniref:Uncharacterized protein n=1 Tax=Aspergillus nanangensis TaxID=2582783 RepID=A0AAD4GTQ6_ASPNN|nr:hypothetical protein FE257_009761 [Aspergillus nanangensis]